MTVTADDVRAMVARSVQRVQGGWIPPRSGRELSTRVSDDMPPLTTGMVESYLAAHAWLWQRETPPEEARRVTDAIAADAATAWARNDLRIRNGVLVVCAFWEEIQQHAPEDQDAIRELLANKPPPGQYPELMPPVDPAEPAAPEVSFKKELITTDDVVARTLDTQAKLGPFI